MLCMIQTQVPADTRRNNNVAMSVWGHNDVIIAPCARYDVMWSQCLQMSQS